MTPDDISPDRALEIIAAHGADAARWPAGERAAVWALAETPAVAAALGQARALDALLGAWAVDVPPRDFDAVALARAGGGRSAQRRGWLAGAVMAAAVATGFAVLAPTSSPPAGVASTTGIPRAASGAPARVPAGEADAEAFATLFTPTADEDELI